MSTDSSSVATGASPQQEANLDPGLAVINAFDDLYEQPPAIHDPDMPPKDSDIPLGTTREGQDNEGDDGEEEAREEDDEFLLPESQGFTPGTAEDFAEKMRFNGLRWRHELRKRVKNDPKLTNGRSDPPARANAARDQKPPW